ncbi:hypothetical protein [Gordonia neofelifaecis]|uniref:hypothetical protein n=1 Tax=Gordonia neofelifaecis TaxID=945692 RepID=UPI0011119BF5|nr:hypothetical protein [Gordonia neofelifaecis]
MTFVRFAWLGLAALALLFTVWAAASPIGMVDLGCATVNTYGPEFRHVCQDSIASVLGARPVIELGLALTVPSVAAAAVMRTWMSWCAATAYVVLTGIGIAHWSDYRLLLTFAGLPATLFALVIAFAHLGARARLDREVELASLAAGTETSPTP